MAYSREEINISPYWDDFESYRNFLRIVFNPSKAVQARELTQMQTLGQNQLGHVVGHLFKDGSPIVGAKVTVSENAPYIEILASDVYRQVDPVPSVVISAPEILALPGTHIQNYTGTASGTTSGALAKILAVDNNGGTLRLQLDYHGGEFTASSPGYKWATKYYTDAEVDALPQKFQSYGAFTSAIGTGLRAKVDPGIVWLNGFFVEIPVQQEIFVTKSGVAGTHVIGYEFEEITLATTTSPALLDPITAVDLGETLKDPAGSSNNGAPGGDRYMVVVNLVSYDITEIDNNSFTITKNDGTVIDMTTYIMPTNFHQLIKMTDGVVEEKLDKTQYADILDLLAGRTYDESGSYTVDPFSLLATKLDASNFYYEVGPGRAYVYGYERENIAPYKISASKTRTFREIAAPDPVATIQAQYGTWVVLREPPAIHTISAITTNEIEFPDHPYGLGDRVLFALNGASVTGMSDGVDYFVIPGTDKDSFFLADTPALANAGTNNTITYASGAPTLTSVGQQGDGVFNPENLDQGYLMTGLCGTGTPVSSNQVRVIYYRQNNGRIRVYLADNTDLLQDLQQARSICSVNTGGPVIGTDVFLNFDDFLVNQTLGFNQPIVQMPAPYMKELTTLKYNCLDRIASTVVTTGVAFTITTSLGGDLFTGEDDAVAFLVNSVGDVIDATNSGIDVFGTTPILGAGSIQADTDHDVPSGTWDFYMMVERPSAVPRTAVLKQEDIDFTVGGSTIGIITFNGTNNGGTITAATSTRTYGAAIAAVIEDPLGAAITLDVTDFSLDDGQKDTYFDYVSVSGSFELSKVYRITLVYWDVAANANDYLAVNSYSKTSTWFDDKGGYESNIPVYTNEAGTKSWLLRDCIDFRKPITEIGSATKEIVEPGSAMVADFDYYLPRKDKVWIDQTGKLGVTEGIAEEYPSYPPDKSGALTLFTVDLIPYLFEPVGTDTHFESDQINVKLVDHKNFTMDDIRKLENRIKGLEAYTSETQLELDSYADTVVDADGLPKSKNGIFVDRFSNHNKGDWSKAEYRCSMDPFEGALHCPFEMNHVAFEYDDVAPVGGSQLNLSEIAAPWTNTITLSYSSVEYLTQPLASEYMNINPFAVIVWSGEIIMNPVSDTWVDTQYAPVMQIQDPAAAAAIRALYERTDTGIPEWGAWRSQIIGVETSRRNSTTNAIGRDRFDANNVFRGNLVTTTTETTSTTEQNTRTGTILEETGSDIITRDMGERTIDVSKIPWMRTIDIVFEAFGMRPDTVVVPYFATIDVTTSVVWDAGNPGGLTTLKGYIKGTFTVPEKTFRTGKNVFTLKEVSVDPLTIASIEFRAEGTLLTKQKEIMSVEVPVYSTRTIEEVVLNVTETSEVTNTRWSDPIAQTFLIEDSGGVFLESVDIFFATRDRYLPVTLMIVETIAGVPGQKRVPFALVTKDAHEVTASYWDPVAVEFKYRGDHYDTTGEGIIAGKDADTIITGSPTDFIPTNFAFSDPIFLKEGVEYAFVLMSNSNNYNAYISRMGQYNIIDGFAIDKQPHLGSLLKSQNTSTWTPDQYADIKFQLNRCQFVTTPSTLYMRVRGETSYWDDVVYAPGDQVIFDSVTDGDLNVYQCVIATGTPNEDPDSQPTKWSLIREGYYDLTSLNISSDDLIIPGTSMTRQYLFSQTAAWVDYTNKQDIAIDSIERVELYIDGETQNSHEPYAIDLKLTLNSESTWHSPVINKNRTFAAVINNLVVGSVAPFDAGVYISNSTLLKENASSLKLLVDVALPSNTTNGPGSITPTYRIVKENLRYLDHGTAASINPFSDNLALKDTLAYVYHIETDFLSESTPELNFDGLQGTVIIDGFDTTNERVYLSSVSNPADFSTVTGDDKIFITTDPDILYTDIFTWVAGSPASPTVLGDYWFDPTSQNLFRVVVAAGSAPPSIGSLDWELVPCVFVDGAIQVDADVEWRPMTQVNTVKDFVDTTRFVEYEYEPLISPSEEFDNFAIKIEMSSQTEVDVPVCKRLRTIAVN